MYIYLQRIFSFCETAEGNNKIHAFDTTVVTLCNVCSVHRGVFSTSGIL